MSIAPNKNACQHQTCECGNFGDSEYVLYRRTQLEAEDIQRRQKNDHNNPRQILRVQPHIHIAESDAKGAPDANMIVSENPSVGSHRREEVSEKLAKGDAHGCDRSSLDYQKECPAIKKAPERA